MIVIERVLAGERHGELSPAVKIHERRAFRIVCIPIRQSIRGGRSLIGPRITLRVD